MGCSCSRVAVTVKPMMGKPRHAWLIALIVAGCNDSMHANNPSSDATASGASSVPENSTPVTPSKSTPTSAPEGAAAAVEEDPSGFDPEMVRIVSARGQRQAVQCPSVAKDTPVGEGEIELVIDGRTGKITDVSLGTTFTAGSASGQTCLRNAFIGQIVTPFKGTKTVTFLLKVPPAEAPTPAATPNAKKDGKKKP